jgi:hypothetical protein
VLVARNACAYSESGFSSQNADRAWSVHYRKAREKGIDAEDIQK